MGDKEKVRLTMNSLRKMNAIYIENEQMLYTQILSFGTTQDEIIFRKKYTWEFTKDKAMGYLKNVIRRVGKVPELKMLL
jgi:hypothetical protein